MSSPHRKRPSLDLIRQRFTWSPRAANKCNFVANSAFATLLRARRNKIDSFRVFGIMTFSNSLRAVTSDMDSIRRNKGFPMKRIFQRWTLVLMMLAPAMVRATPILDFSSGFAGSTSTLNFNGSAQISGTRARITNGGFLQVGSVWSKNQVDIRKFSCQFTFQITTPNEAGFTFAIQRAGNTLTAYPYENLGFSPMSLSFAVKFDIYPKRKHDRYLLEWGVSI